MSPNRPSTFQTLHAGMDVTQNFDLILKICHQNTKSNNSQLTNHDRLGDNINSGNKGAWYITACH